MESDEMEALGAALRRLCTQDAVAGARRQACDPGITDTATTHTVDAGLVDMGLPVMLLPEVLGGAGGSPAAVAAAMAELGRHAAVSDLADDVVASWIIGTAASPVAVDLATQLGAGARIAIDDAYYNAAAEPLRERGGSICGELRVARWSPETPAGVVGLLRGSQFAAPVWIPWADLTVIDEWRDPAGVVRRTLRFDGAPAVLDDSGALVARASALARIAMSSWLLGVSEGARNLVVEYGRLRESFGRVIGSYQAFKQRCAENWVSAKLLAALLRECVGAWERCDADYLAMASSAAGLACETASVAGSDGILLHGAIGFTWEHDAHLFLRAALSAAGRLGGPSSQFADAGRDLGLVGARS